MRALQALAVTLCLGAVGPARAQEKEPIETDRPDISEASTVVGRGRFQIETGIQRDYQREGGRRVRTLTTPTLLRLGLDNRWEARLETDGYTHLRSSGAGGAFQSAGLSAVAPGFKYHLQDPLPGSPRPSLGVLFHLVVPGGSTVFRTNQAAGDLKLAADFDLGNEWALGTNVGIVVDRDERSSPFLAALATASLSRSLTDRLRAYSELALGGARVRPISESVIFDGGFTYLLNLDTQLDVALGTDLSRRAAPDLFWTVGLSRRF